MNFGFSFHFPCRAQIGQQTKAHIVEKDNQRNNFLGAILFGEHLGERRN
jgi:hypothetical protein